jgi:transposase-like protein
MANVLSGESRVAVIGALAEGASFRSVERMLGVHRDTIMRLGVRVGQGCERLLDRLMHDLPCQKIQVDELWGYVGKHHRRITPDDHHYGDAWIFVAIDADTKLVPCFRVGKRDTETARAFVPDLAGRLTNRV